MDEPFGALDALTRLAGAHGPRGALAQAPADRAVHHAQRRGGVGLSDRILVMGPSPGRVVEEIRVDLPRPRPIVLGDVKEFAAVRRAHSTGNSNGSACCTASMSPPWARRANERGRSRGR
jgi:NitT/TauT family transport system ATP-binding protein